MENTQEEDARKGESMLTRFGVIKKIGVYCYDVTIENHNGAVGTISSEENQLIIIGINEEELEERTEDEDADDEGFVTSTSYDLVSEEEMFSDEVMERFNLSESMIKKILDGENLELDDWDLRGTDYFYECGLTIEEVREKRRIDSEPFDAEEIISKIANEYVLTPKRKALLIKIMNKY